MIRAQYVVVCAIIDGPVAPGQNLPVTVLGPYSEDKAKNRRRAIQKLNPEMIVTTRKLVP